MRRVDIARALGIKNSGVLYGRLKDLPRPAGERRKLATPELRAQAVGLRSSGLSYREIRAEVPVSKSTLSLWLRDVALTDEHRAALNEMRRAAG